jgi:hypothetical protein
MNTFSSLVVDPEQVLAVAGGAAHIIEDVMAAASPATRIFTPDSTEA